MNLFNLYFNFTYIAIESIIHDVYVRIFVIK